MANLFNDAGVADVEAFEWIVADTARSDFGTAVPDEMIQDGVLLRDSALVEIEGEEVFCCRVPVANKAAWILSREATKGDSRLLGDFRDGQGKRYLEFRAGVTKMMNAKMDDWPLAGPRAVLEFLKAVREGASDLATYHLNWSQSSGVSFFGSAVHEHRVLCDILRVGISIDQVDLSNLLCAELAVRRLIQIEMAVARNPSCPDYSGLDLVMEQPVGASGQAVTMDFTNWISSKLKERANVQKQARLYREEFGGRRGRGSGDKGGHDDKGRGRGRGRGKQGKSSAGDSSGAGPSTRVLNGCPKRILVGLALGGMVAILRLAKGKALRTDIMASLFR